MGGGGYSNLQKLYSPVKKGEFVNNKWNSVTLNTILLLDDTQENKSTKNNSEGSWENTLLPPLTQTYLTLFNWTPHHPTLVN